MLFSPNIAFTSLIKIDGRLHEFNFRKKNDSIYETDVSDDRGVRHYFEMVRSDETWKIKEKILPPWVIKNEEQIASEILQKG